MRKLLLQLKRKVRHHRKLYLALGDVFGLYRNAIMKLSLLFGGFDDNMVVFSAFDHRSYNDNPRYISEKLHELRPETKIVWLFNDVDEAIPLCKALMDGGLPAAEVTFRTAAGRS